MELKTIAPVLPAGYKQLEYIESTGTQYIETGYKHNSSTILEVKQQFYNIDRNENFFYFNGADNNSGNDNALIWTCDKENTVTARFRINAGSSSNWTVVQNTADELWHIWLFQNNIQKLDGTLITSLPLYQCNYNICLFGRNSGGSVNNICYSRIAYCKIWDNNTLVRNFIPSQRLSDNAVGMYDTVSNTFFENQGTGSFIAGPEVTTPTKELKEIKELYKRNTAGTGVDYIGEMYKKNPEYVVLPDGYTQLEYIENSTAGPFFITGIQPITEKTVVEIKGYVTNGNSAFGGDGDNTPLFNSTSNSATKLYFRYGNTAIVEINNTNGKFYNIPATIKFGNNKMYLDGELKQTLSEEPFTYNYPMKIWSRQASSTDPAIGRLYFANIYNEDILVFKGVPCKRNSDSVLGLYDTVTNTFFTNRGSGTFIAGPEIPKVLPVFSAGYATTIQGTSPLTLPNARAKTTSWKIEGNSKQGILPNGYTQLEYIETSNTGAWINSGIPTTNNLKIDTKFTINNISKILFGGRSNASGGNGITWGFIGGSTGSRNTYNMYGSVNSPTDISVDVIDNQPHTLVFGSSIYTIDGIEQTSRSTVGEITESNDIYIGTWNSIGTPDARSLTGRIYYFKIYNELTGALLFNGIACKNSSNVVGLYDTVSGTFRSSIGTEQFTAGSILPLPTNPVDIYGVGNSGLPNEYRKLEYIESSGTQWIDTGFTLNNNSSVEINYQLTQAVQLRAGLFGGLYMGDTTSRYGSLLSPTSGSLEYGYGNDNIYFQQGLPDTLRHTLKQDKTNVYFDGALVHSFNSVTFTCGGTMPLGTFAYTNYTPALAKYYYCKIWDNGTLVRNFIPAKRNSDNILGMYDLVSGQFFTNAGTGTFTAGPEDTSCVVPILQANNCGSYTFTGNETSQVLLDNWRPTDTTYAVGFKYSLFGDGVTFASMDSIGPAYCNSGDLLLNTYSDLYGGSVSPAYCYYTGSQNQYSLFVRLPKTIANSKTDVLNWLKGKTIYYQRTTDTTWNTPTTTNITLPAPLQKLGTYKDSIESDGTLTREIGVKIFDEITAWSISGWAHTTRNPFFYNGLNGTTVDLALCTHLPIQTWEIIEPDHDCFMYRANNILIWLPVADYPDVASFKAWLAAQKAAGTPVQLVYPLATATETTVQVPTISTSKGVNYVDVDTDVAPSNVEITYRKRNE